MGRSGFIPVDSYQALVIFREGYGKTKTNQSKMRGDAAAPYTLVYLKLRFKIVALNGRVRLVFID